MAEVATAPDREARADEDAGVTPSPADLAIDVVTARQQEALEGFEHAGAALFDGLARAQREMSEFLAARLREDLETQQQFLRCRTFDEMRKLQTQFVSTAMEQYSAEATRLMRLGGEVMSRSLERRS